MDGLLIFSDRWQAQSISINQDKIFKNLTVFLMNLTLGIGKSRFWKARLEIVVSKNFLK